MKSIDRIDINTKRPIPATIKVVLLITVIFGIWLRTNWIKKQAFTLRIYNIVVADVTNTSVEVKFNVNNPNDLEITKKILIKAFTPDNELIASRITEITASPKSKKTYLKMLNQLNIPIKEMKDVGDVTIEIYTPRIFD